MRVLIVEDEFLVAAAVEMIVRSMGHDVVGPVGSIEAAITALDESATPDAAIVDLNLRGRPSEPVAQELDRRHIPFVFASGYEIDSGLQARFPAARWLRKPYTDRDISASLAQMSEGLAAPHTR